MMLLMGHTPVDDLVEATRVALADLREAVRDHHDAADLLSDEVHDRTKDREP